MVQERLWTDHHHPSSLLNHHNHHHPKTTTELVVCASPENGCKDTVESTQSSDSEDLHYGPGIVNKLRNKYLSLALKQSNSRPTILRKATSLENLLDNDVDDDEDGVDGETGTNEDTRLFRRRGGGKDAIGRAHLRHFKSSNGRQEMKRARSVETISRNSHDDVITITPSEIAKLNNRKSLHEDILINNQNEDILDKLRSHQQKPGLFENGVSNNEMTNNEKFNHRIIRPKRIPPLLNEREKPPADVVKHAKMIFEKRPEQRTKRPPQTGDVAAKVDSFNNIIVKAKVALKATKPPIKHTKPLSNNEKLKNNANINNHQNNQHHHHIRPSAKPVILNEEMTKPISLELKGSKKVKREIGNNLPSPIPDVSRVDFKNHDDSKNNTPTNLCETPDLIMTSSPLPKITSPSFKKRSTENFLKQEKNSAIQNAEAINRFISPISSPTKSFIPFHKGDLDSTAIRQISPISQNNISKHAAASSSVFNFVNANVNQKHLPTMNKNVSDCKVPYSEPLNIDVNGFSNSNDDSGLSALEIENNQKNTLRVDGAQNEPSAVSKQQRNSKVRDVELIQETLNLIKSTTRNSSETNNCSNTTSITVNDNNKNKKNLDHFNGVKEIANSESNAKIIKSETVSDGVKINNEISSIPIQNTASKNLNVKTKNATKLHDEIDRSSLKPVQCTATSENRTNNSDSNDNSLSAIFSVKKHNSNSSTKTINRTEASNTAVFNFTARKEVPDYIANDKSRAPSRPAIPKPDEPGIKLLTDLVLFPNYQEELEEEELIKSLEARPPSPCDITFINDNVLIGGRSSISQALSKKGKLKISFIEDPDIHEYPSESSLLNNELSPPQSPSSTNNSQSQVGHTVPLLSGSSLATYTPKTGGEFQLGVTRPTEPPPVPPSSKTAASTENDSQSNDIFEEINQPVVFSSGSTSDILF